VRCVAFVLLATLAAPVFGGLPQANVPPAPNAVRVLVPIFSGGRIGRAVASVITLQVWRTLRTNTDDSTGTTGEVARDVPLSAPSFEAAEERGRLRGAAVVVWGEAVELEDGVVVQAHLALVERSRVPSTAWEVTTHGGREIISLDLLHRHYDFEPITLPRSLIASVGELSSLPIYKTATSRQILGHVGNDPFSAVEWSGDAIKIGSNKVQGWIRLKQLDQLENEVDSFTGGVVRILRRDFLGADELFCAVLRHENLPETIAIDASIYRAISRYHALSRGGRRYSTYVPYPIEPFEILRLENELRAAIDRNPYMKSSAAALMIVEAAEAQRLALDAEEERLALQQLAASTNRYRTLFPPDDRFMNQIDALIRAVRQP